MRFELTVACEILGGGKPQTITVTHEGDVIGMLLISPILSSSDVYAREQRDALAGMLLASVSAAYVKIKPQLEAEARKKALDDVKRGM